jgi:hypothetical protein
MARRASWGGPDLSPVPPGSDVTSVLPWEPPADEQEALNSATSDRVLDAGPVDTTDTMTAERIMGDDAHDPMPAQDLLGEMKRQGMNVGQVRELLAHLDIEAPDDLRSVEARSRFFGGLEKAQRIGIAKALVERAKVPA